MSKKRTKQYLMLLMVVGLVSIAAGGGGGTFASFNAQVTNPGNYFASGTLFLHNTHGATTCTSESASLNVNPGDGSNGDTCATLFTADLGAGAATATLALNNAGSLPSSNLEFSVDNCTVGDNSAVTGSSVTFGTAPTCGDLDITVQQKTSSAYTTNAWCAYGPSTTEPACDAPDSSATLANTSSLTSLNMDDGSNASTAATLAAGATKYYVITISPSVASGNTLQNRKVSFDLTWNIDQ